MDFRTRDARLPLLQWATVLVLIIGTNVACLSIYTTIHSRKAGGQSLSSCDHEALFAHGDRHGRTALLHQPVMHQRDERLPYGVGTVKVDMSAAPAHPMSPPSSAAAAAVAAAASGSPGLGSPASAASEPKGGVGRSSRSARQHLARCPLPGYCTRTKLSRAVNVSSYLGKSPYKVMQGHREAVERFINSSGFPERVASIKGAEHQRGILIPAGGAGLLSMALTSIHILRKQYNCTLPIEIAYTNKDEADPATRAFVSRSFPNVYWVELAAQPWPAQQRPGYTPRSRYEWKAIALYFTRFREALLLDADNLPLRDPSYIFDSPQFQGHGNLFWTDYWTDFYHESRLVPQEGAFQMAGINMDRYQELLRDGQGPLRRTFESGQLLVDRARHADVLEYAVLLNSFSFPMEIYMHGDKDLFGFAFAYAGKAQEMMHIPVPPGAMLRQIKSMPGGMWQPQEAPVGPRWGEVAMLHAGMTQHDHYGRILFLHLTTSKWSADSGPAAGDYITGPVPEWFVRALGLEATDLLFTGDMFHPVHMGGPGPTGSGRSDGPDAAAAPAAAAAACRRDAASPECRAACPPNVLVQYMALQQHNLPVMWRAPGTEAACFEAALKLRRKFEGDGSLPALTPSAAMTNESRAMSMAYDLAEACAAGAVEMAGSKPCWEMDWHTAAAVADMFTVAKGLPLLKAAVRRRAGGDPRLKLVTSVKPPLPLLIMDINATGDDAAVACVLKPLFAERIPHALAWIQENIQSMPIFPKPKKKKQETHHLLQ